MDEVNDTPRREVISDASLRRAMIIVQLYTRWLRSAVSPVDSPSNWMWTTNNLEDFVSESDNSWSLRGGHCVCAVHGVRD